jgi:hypothetical protein
MNKQKVIAAVVVLGLMAGTAQWLAQFKTKQRLGEPGVKTSAMADSKRLRVELPERVLNYDSEFIETDPIVLGALPHDTSFGQRIYKSTNSYPISLNVVLMGNDRSSMHKPQLCLEGQGWHIDYSASTVTNIHVEKPVPYELPVVKLIANREGIVDGQRSVARGIYVYWFVADNAMSASVQGFQRMWIMSKHLLLTGELQRWAYVSCFSVCPQGEEDAEYERMKDFIVAAVPEFQLTPKPAAASSVAAK